MNRLLLVNNKLRTRGNIMKVDRAIGEAALSHLNLEFGGYIAAQNHGLVAQWLVRDDQLTSVVNWVMTHSLPGYTAEITVTYRSAS